MARRVTVLLGILMLLPVAISLAAVEPAGYDERSIIVRFRAESAPTVGEVFLGARATGYPGIDRLNDKYGADGLERLFRGARPAPFGKDLVGLHAFFVVRFPDAVDLDRAVAEYAADPNIQFAEKVAIMPMYVTPNDPEFSQQWSLHKTGDQDMDLPEAWEFETGDSTVIMAIVDSGVKYLHEDLRRSVWVNPGEDLDGDGKPWDTTSAWGEMNGVDDDMNGYVDDLVGYDFLPTKGTNCWPGEECGGPDMDPDDFDGHGTHLSGIVAATTNNIVGVAGIAGGWVSDNRPPVKIMCLRSGWTASDGLGYVDMSACSEAIDYAVNHGAAGVNCSWGTSGGAIVAAIQNALANGLVVTHAAGNDNSGSAQGVVEGISGVLDVASTTRLDQRSSWSNYGVWVEIAAPGGESFPWNIYNTYSFGGAPGYAQIGGTSMSSPAVLGVAALIKSHHPSWTYTSIDSAMIADVDTIDHLNPGFEGLLGAGRVNAHRTLVNLTTADFTVDQTFGHVPLAVSFTNASPNATAPWDYQFDDGGSATTSNALHSYTAPGVYSPSLTGDGPTGAHTRLRPYLIVAVADTIEYQDITIEANDKQPIPVRMRNSHPMDEIWLPFKFTGPASIFIDSIVTGPRTPNFQITDFIFDNRFAGEVTARLKADNLGGEGPGALPAGEGIVAYLWVRTNVTAQVGQIEAVDSATFQGTYLRLQSKWADFTPQFIPGTITVTAPPCDCPNQGDVAPLATSGDGAIDVLDVVATIDHVFRSGPVLPTDEPVCPAPRGDIAPLTPSCGDGAIDVLDVVGLIDHVFRSGPAPCDPCA